MQICQILDKIDEKHLFVPAFQREYVWKRVDVKNLIKSLLSNYPTGTMLTWETTTPPELKGNHKYTESQGAVKIILDGQQRITTLYMLVRGKIPPYYTKEDITNEIWDLYINIENLELEYFKKNVMENNPLWIQITKIFKNQIDLLDITDEINLARKNRSEKNNEEFIPVSRELQRTINENLNKIKKILEKDFLEQTVPIKASLKEAIDIFYIVNSSGVNLTDAELALAQMSGYWPEIREKIKQKQNSLSKEGWVFRLDFYVYCILGVLFNLGSKMEKLHDSSIESKVKAAWERLSNETFDYVINLLKTHAYIDHTKEIGSPYALIPIIVYSFNQPKSNISENERNRIIKWFYYSQIRYRYVSSLQQKLDKDLGVIRDNKYPFDALLKIIEEDRRLEIQPEEFIGAGIQNALWSMMKWYFKSKNAICFTTGIGIRKNMGERYTLEWDHIFPYSALAKRGYGIENRHNYSLAQEITNRAVLTQLANRSKSDSEAENYLNGVSLNMPSALEKQCVPKNSELWKIENFELFLKERRKILAQEINNFLENLSEPIKDDFGYSITELIEQGENFGVEFKSSLRWDYENSKINSLLEDVILKTIAGFANLDGGLLIIGVKDDKEILGLENDYSTFKAQNKDGFELHLMNIISSKFGKDFATLYVSTRFETMDDKEICIVSVKPSDTPIYTEVTDKNGQKSIKFYVRRGNSTQELDLRETNDFVNAKFR